MTSAIQRSSEMWLVGFFLSRFGRPLPERPPLPPAQLSTDEWGTAYAIFFGKLGAGRTLSTFRNSLKNARDCFDAHHGSGRVGWRESGSATLDRRPLPLTGEARSVLDKWGTAASGQVWALVKPYADLRVPSLAPHILSDLAAELEQDSQDLGTKTEGGRRVVISIRTERDPSLRHDAIRIHGTKCMVCGFDFGTRYGSWGSDFIEVHHIRPLAEIDGERSTDPRLDLAVLCPNCHRMIHRRKGITLTLDELRAKLQP